MSETDAAVIQSRGHFQLPLNALTRRKAAATTLGKRPRADPTLRPQAARKPDPATGANHPGEAAVLAFASAVTPSAAPAPWQTTKRHADVLFARYVEHLVLREERLTAEQLAKGDPVLVAALAERIEAFRKIDEILGRPPESLLGRTLGHYRILESLGAGGMGEVYRAQDLALRREVAVKVLPPRFALDPDRRARFENEARLLARLDHPNITAVHSIERCDGLAFLVLELVVGETLARRIARGPFPLPLTLRLFGEIAGALQAVHLNKIVHRDLKPANVLITPDGHAKLLDFSLGKACPESEGAEPAPVPSPAPTPTASGIILGTASYMSPEQARGKQTDRRTDVWAFGCVFFEALSGRPAFRGESLSDIVANVLVLDPDWRLLPPTTPAPIRKLLRLCLEKDRERRLPGMAEACAMIERARPDTR
jgi:serine/threonine protein kinase